MSFPDPIQQSDAFIAYLRAENIDFCVRLFERYQARPPDLSDGRLDEANLVKWCEDICTLLSLPEQQAPSKRKAKEALEKEACAKVPQMTHPTPCQLCEPRRVACVGPVGLACDLCWRQHKSCSNGRHRDPDASTKEMPVSVAQSASRKCKARPSVDAHIARTISRSDNEAGPSTRSRGKRARTSASTSSNRAFEGVIIPTPHTGPRASSRRAQRRTSETSTESWRRTLRSRKDIQGASRRSTLRSCEDIQGAGRQNGLMLHLAVVQILAAPDCYMLHQASGWASDVGRQLSDIGRLVSRVRRQALDISAGCDSPEETQAHYWNAEQSDGSYTQYGIVRPRSGGPGGQISTQSDKVFKAGGMVITQIWCHLGKTGTIGLLKCLHWKADQSGTGLAWKANMKRVERIFNAILEHPDLITTNLRRQGAKRSIPSGAAGPAKGA
ncbi:hypothetical protein BJV78DRAFT_1159118 [Lactifluus subvellereus]|nr:hypothetical protein BJV78DRAFT_1159118 [Lactifluus subvellereus]